MRKHACSVMQNIFLRVFKIMLISWNCALQGQTSNMSGCLYVRLMTAIDHYSGFTVQMHQAGN